MLGTTHTETFFTKGPILKVSLDLQFLLRISPCPRVRHSAKPRARGSIACVRACIIHHAVVVVARKITLSAQGAKPYQSPSACGFSYRMEKFVDADLGGQGFCG